MNFKSLVLTTLLPLLGFCTTLSAQTQNTLHHHLKNVKINIYEHHQDLSIINNYMALLMLVGCILGFKYRDKYFKE